MKKPLQETSWKKSQYEQPHRNWVCGLSNLGLPCSHGPDSKGGCPLVGQCTPAKKGDEFVCCRSDELGGPCTLEPFSESICQKKIARCQPKQSWMQLRKRIVLCTVALALGFCLLIYGKSSPTEIMSPGLLSFAHGDLNSKCAECHTAAEGGILNWSAAIVDTKIAMADSEKCLSCHVEIGGSPFNAHGMTVSHLEEITKQFLSKSGTKRIDRAAENLSLTCSRCHHEHQGQKFDIAKIADSQCQLCHQKQFNSFSHGHPEFVDFPYESRSKIYFDHSRHYGLYFEESEFRRLMPSGVAPKSCLSCHHQDASGQFMQTKKYETMCASCHDEEILDQQFAGIPLFALPSFTHKDLPDDSEVKNWPNTSQSSTLEFMPAFMSHLLSRDADFQSAKKALGEQHFSKLLITAESSDLKDVESYLNSIRSLVEEVSKNGDAALESRSKELSISKLSPTIVEPIRRIHREWFLNSDSNISEKIDIINPQGGGWSLSNDDRTLRYRPIGHSDLMLKRLLDETVDYGFGHSDDKNLKELFESLSQPTAAGTKQTNGPIASGRCLTCHSVEKKQDGRFEIQWDVYQPVSQKLNLTKFSHKPHVKMGQTEQCNSCHQFEAESGMNSLVFQPQFFERKGTSEFWETVTNPNSSLSSGFTAISKNSCAECHTKKLAGESCLKCHDYHLLKSHK